MRQRSDILAELAVCRLERWPWYTERSADAARQVFRFGAVVRPSLEQPFAELMSDSVIHLAGRESTLQVDDRFSTWPDERASSGQLSALGKTNAAPTEQRDSELYRAGRSLRVGTRALVDLANRELRDRIHQAIAHLPHLSSLAMSDLPPRAGKLTSTNRSSVAPYATLPSVS